MPYFDEQRHQQWCGVNDDSDGGVNLGFELGDDKVNI